MASSRRGSNSVTLQIEEKPRQARTISIYDSEAKATAPWGGRLPLATATHKPSPTHSDLGTWHVFATGVGTFDTSGMPDYAMRRLLRVLAEGEKVVAAQEAAEQAKPVTKPRPRTKR